MPDVVDRAGPAVGDSIRGELHPSRLIASVTTGLILGVMLVVLASSFAAIIFTGELGARLSDGIGLALFTAVVSLLGVALTSSLPGAIATAQDVTAAIVALATGAIAGRMANPEALFLTVVAAISITTLLTGACFLLIGGLRLGNLVRFMPYPVVGGFLAGTGWLLVKGGVGVASGIGVSLGTLDDLAATDAVVRWLPAVAFGVLILVATRRIRHPLLIPSLVVGGVVAFYLMLLLAGTSLGTAESEGWLIGPFPEGGLWTFWTVDALTGARWSEILRELPTLLTVPVLAVVTLLLNTSGIELATQEDVDLNREMRSAGMANVAAAAGGGIVGFHALSLTALAHRAGARTRGTGVVAAAVCLVTMLIGASYLSFFPRTVLAGLVVFLGLSFLMEWVVDAARKLPRGEYLLVLAIVATIAAFGFLVGVGIGLAAALVMFVVQYSKTDVVKHALSGEAFHSRVDRDPEARELLRRDGQGIHILELQGFVFFGTANSLVDRIRARAGEDPPIRFLVVDFRRVIGIDSSAVLSFVRVAQLAKAGGFTLVLSDIGPRVLRQLEHGGLPVEREHVRGLADLDRALQWCEDRLIESGRQPQEDEARRTAVLRNLLGNEVDLVRLVPYLEVVDVQAGTTLIHEGEVCDELFLLTAGRVSAMMARPDDDPVRLRTMGPGTVVGEVALYLGGERTASVVSEEPSRLYKLTRSALARMDRDDPDLAAAFHRAIARLLADRLTDALRSMDALLD